MNLKGAMQKNLFAGLSRILLSSATQELQLFATDMLLCIKLV